jgi:hypothetical protein
MFMGREFYVARTLYGEIIRIDDSARLAMVSCTTQYSVQGVASQAVLDGRTAYLRTMDGRSDVAIDSCKVLHGKFSMTGPWIL